LQSSYVDPASGHLKYAVLNQTGWTTWSIVTTGEVYSINTSIAVDASGRIHISYYQIYGPGCEGGTKPATCDSDIVNNFKLKYITSLDGINWSEEFVDQDFSNPVSNGKWNALALTSSGNPVVAYSAVGQTALRVAKRSSTGTWTSSTVDDNGRNYSLWVDKNTNTVSVTYVRYLYNTSTNNTTREISFAHETSPGVWAKETVAVFVSDGEVIPENDSSFTTSLVFDGANVPYISFHNPVSQSLEVAYRNAFNLGWGIKVITGPNEGRYNSMTLDINSNPVLSYYDETNRELKVAYVVDKASSWDSDGDGIYNLLDHCPDSNDCDGDGLMDPQEDINRNGQIDLGETDPARSDTVSIGMDMKDLDTDSDGWPDDVERFYGSNIASLDSIPGLPIRISTQFKDVQSDDLATWSIRDDSGTRDYPSVWQIEDGLLTQKSNIYGFTIPYGKIIQPGSFAIAGQSCWRDYDLHMRFRSDDDGVIGIAFRYLDEQNYYLLSLDRNQGIVRVVRKENGGDTVLSEVPYIYAKGYYHQVSVMVSGNLLQIFIDALSSIESPLIELNDPKLSSWSGGKIGLYTSYNQAVFFDHVIVLKPINGADSCSSSDDGLFPPGSQSGGGKNISGTFFGCGRIKEYRDGSRLNDDTGSILLTMLIVLWPVFFIQSRQLALHLKKYLIAAAR